MVYIIFTHICQSFVACVFHWHVIHLFTYIFGFFSYLFIIIFAFRRRMFINNNNTCIVYCIWWKVSIRSASLPESYNTF